MSDKNFNKLKPAETERLALIMEECGELIQAAGKVLRHGYYSFNPDDPKQINNANDLAKEMADVQHAINFILENKDVGQVAFENRLAARPEKVSRYLHHQVRGGNRQ